MPIMEQIKAKTKRVAVYARVSTDHLEQQTSLEAQKDYYAKEIENHKDWVLAGIYADDGISGTSYLKREAFLKMLEDCRNGKIDMILTKSVSRFARNTVDALNTIRELKSLNIGVYFQKENIWTLDSKGEFLITLMTSLAQEESRSLSENVTWGQRKRIADGNYSVAYSRFLGYDYGFEVNEKEAAVVRNIYKQFLQGYTAHTIALNLTEAKIPTPGDCEHWNASTIRSILSNEKYKGDALSQKSYTVDFLTKKHKKNNGELPKYYVENGHEAIIAPWLFDYVQEKLNARLEYENRYSGNSIYSGRIICGKCGNFYGSKIEHSNDKYRSFVWMCRNRFKSGIYCRNTRIYEEKLPDIICKIATAYISGHLQVLKLCEQVMRETGNEHLLPFLQNKHIRNFELDAIEELSLVIEKITIYPGGKLTVEFISGAEQRISINKRINVTYQSPVEAVDAESLPCEQCGVLVQQHPKRKRKRFCCDACRMKWWNDHRDANAVRTEDINCQGCGKVVKAIKGSGRKYCCHECYIKDRFGKG